MSKEGGCATVGVAGLIQSGGFGSFSKYYGMAAAGLIEAEVVTADGAVRVANERSNPDLFWALKGGGGGTFGVVTRLTLRTRELPGFFGGIILSVTASSDLAYKKLLETFVLFYAEHLYNPHWGEQVVFAPGNRMSVQMLFADLTEEQAGETWKPFVEGLRGSGKQFVVSEPVLMKAIPARSFWDPQFWKKNLPDFVVADDRPGAPEGNIFWVGNRSEAGQILQAYQSAWLPSILLPRERQQQLVEALVDGSRHWSLSLHFNKGLAGSAKGEIEAASKTAINPAALDAFALVISASEAQPGNAGSPSVSEARKNAAFVRQAMEPLLRLLPAPASYVSESDYFEREWQRAFWGPNYRKLAEVKKKYDPNGLFMVHHGVGSEHLED